MDGDAAVTGLIAERVIVTAASDTARHGHLPNVHVLEGVALHAGSAGLVNDPVRLASALPGVVAGDDFRGELSIRGSPYRHTALVVEDVATSWLTHAAPGRGTTSSLSMLRGDVLERATLERGAYARRHGDHLGAQLSLAVREGSRSANRFTGSISGTNTAVTGEGPLGASSRGSWLVAARHSHVEWPIGRTDHDTTVFGFADMQSKLVFDLTPTQQIGTAMVAGHSAVQREQDDVSAVADGANRAALSSVYWRSLVRPGIVVRQRASLVAQTFENRNGQAEIVDGGHQRDAGYRIDITTTVPRGILDVGAQVRRLNGTREDVAERRPVTVMWWTRATYAQLRASVTPRLMFSAGVRLSGSTLSTRSVADRWLAAEWRVGSNWSLHGSSGVVHQFVTFDDRLPWAFSSRFAPERANQTDLGVRGELGSLGWDVTAFARRERDAIRDADRSSIGGPAPVDAASPGARFSGLARGIEIRLEQPRSAGLSWRTSYSYGKADYTNADGGPRFAADLDQRHGVTASAFYRSANRLTTHAMLRAGSGMPLPGYLMAREDGLYVGTALNQVRLPAYARLDLRVERTFTTGSRRHLTPFAEVVNVLNRANLGAASGVIRPRTGEAIGFTERLFPRLMTAGLRVEF
jgi:hypothetical protein